MAVFLRGVGKAHQRGDGFLRQHQTAIRKADADAAGDVQQVKKSALLGKRKVAVAGAEAVCQKARRKLRFQVAAQIVADVFNRGPGGGVENDCLAHAAGLCRAQEPLRLASQRDRHQNHLTAVLQKRGHVLPLGPKLRTGQRAVRQQIEKPPDCPRPGGFKDSAFTAADLVFQFIGDGTSEPAQVLQRFLPADAGQLCIRHGCPSPPNQYE